MLGSIPHTAFTFAREQSVYWPCLTTYSDDAAEKDVDGVEVSEALTDVSGDDKLDVFEWVDTDTAGSVDASAFHSGMIWRTGVDGLGVSTYALTSSGESRKSGETTNAAGVSVSASSSGIA